MAAPRDHQCAKREPPYPHAAEPIRPGFTRPLQLRRPGLAAAVFPRLTGCREDGRTAADSERRTRDQARMRHDLRLTSRHRGRESDSPIHELVMSQLCLPAATVFTSPMTTGRLVRACASLSSASGRDLSSQTWIRVPVVRGAPIPRTFIDRLAADILDRHLADGTGQ